VPYSYLKHEENVDISAGLEVVITIGRTPHVTFFEFLARSSSPTTFIVEASADGETWLTKREIPDVSEFYYSCYNVCPYLRFRILPSAGATATYLIVGGTLS